MSKVKIGINGFGRIGRLVTRALLDLDEKVDIVGINDLSSPDMLAHLFEYDSVHGRFGGSVEIDQGDLIFDGDRFKVYAEKDPANLPWKELETDYVIECTGFFRTRETINKHIVAGAKRVILSAPAKSASDVDLTLCLGVNHTDYDPSKHFTVSNASCTTNCLATTVKVLDDAFGFIEGMMTTIHAYTNDQRILDSQHKDFRRARSGPMNIIPTSTGAAKAVGLVLPHLEGKIDGVAVRVPTPNVSIVDMSARLKQAVTEDDVKNAFRDAAETNMKGILTVEERELVSSDFNGNPYSSIVDLPMVKVVDKNLVNIFAWYDNEVAFSTRLAELVHFMWDQEK